MVAKVTREDVEASNRLRSRPRQQTERDVRTKRKQPPIIFIHRDPINRHRSRDEAKMIASHASGCYRQWERSSRRKIVLDSSTRSILGQRFGPSPVEEDVSLPTPPPTALDMIRAVDKKGNDEYRSIVARLDVYHRKMIGLAGTYEEPFNSVTFAFQRIDDRVRTATHGDAAFSSGRTTPPITPNPTICLPTSFDPFSTSSAMFDPEVRFTLHFYFKVIRPFVCHLIPGWNWFDNLSEIQSKPVLAYAVATLSSTFLSGCLKGGPGVVLPPLPSDADLSNSNSQEGLLWPIPSWFRLQAMCIRELNKELGRQTDDGLDEGIFQAVLFLFRLAVLLADGATAQMHHTALGRMEKLRPGRPGVEMGKELSVLRVNVVAAFLHSASLVVVKTRRNGSHVVEIDSRDWGHREYWNHQALQNSRLFAWRAATVEGESAMSTSRLLCESNAALERMDPGAQALLDETEWEAMVRCYQVALYLFHYLNAVSYSTRYDGVRGQMLELNKRLAGLDLDWIHCAISTTLFVVLLAGAMGSRGRVERSYFIRSLANLYKEEVKWMDDVFALIARCIDPFGRCWSVVEEIWEEVLEWRLGRWKHLKGELGTGKVELYNKPAVRPVEENRPIGYEPDLTAETRVMESEDDPCLKGVSRLGALP